MITDVIIAAAAVAALIFSIITIGWTYVWNRRKHTIDAYIELQENLY